MAKIIADGQRNLMMVDVRCKRCKRLLLKGRIKTAEIEIKCRECKYINKFSFPRMIPSRRIEQEIATT